MTAIYQFLARYEIPLYILLLIGGLFAVRWLWRAWNEWRNSRYSLEKEFALRRMGQAIAGVILLLVLFCGEFFAASFIAPGLPASLSVPTGTLDVISTPLGTISPDLATQLAQTPSAAAPSANSQGCIPDRVNITAPKSGSEIQGTVDIQGTVNIPDFGFYKYEVSPAGSDSWATISAGRDKVVDGSLGQWDTTVLSPGDYQLRLVVTDNQGQALSPCVITIRITPQS
ncbi:MAG: hypothetical protein ACM3QS_01220 [Bacteroidota bacterium]